MELTESAWHTARCTNVEFCPRAAAGDAVEWYLGAGEYCPECGEALVAGDAVSYPLARSGTSAPISPAPGEANPIASSAVSGKAKAAVFFPATGTPLPLGCDVRLPLTAVDRLTVPPTAREAGFMLPLQWFCIVTTTLVATALVAVLPSSA